MGSQYYLVIFDAEKIGATASTVKISLFLGLAPLPVFGAWNNQVFQIYSPILPGMTRTRISLTISLAPGSNELLNRMCKATNRNRSALIQAALSHYLSPEDLTVTRPSPSQPTSVQQPHPRVLASATAPLTSAFVELLMPGATPKEKEEASRTWFAYLRLLDETVVEREADNHPSGLDRA